MSDEEWEKRRKRLFSSLYVKPAAQDSMDQFIGKLRELEDGSDPHAKTRLTAAQESTLDIALPHYKREFRDKRDEEIYTMFETGLGGRRPSERQNIFANLEKLSKLNRKSQ